MTARRRRACAHAPKRCRPCYRRSRRADARKGWAENLTEKPTMHRWQRLIAATIVIALSGALAGCSSMGNWDPTDMLDFLDTKKKLPGERKPVFPDGVPGLEQGVPKELYKGARQQQIVDPNAQATAAAAPPPEEPKSKSSAKSKGKQAPATVAAAPAAEPAAAGPDAAPEEEGSTAAAPPAPKPQKVARKRTTAPPPDQSAAQSPQQSAAPFPAPMPSGSFTR